MAKLKMCGINIAVIKDDRRRLVSFLQKHGVVELRRLSGIDGFAAQDTTAQRLRFEQAAQTAANALEILNEYAPEKRGKLDFLNGRRVLDEQQYKQCEQQTNQTLKSCYDIVALERQLGDCRAEISRISIAVDELTPFMQLDVPVGLRGTKKTAVFIGTIPRQITTGELTEQLQNAGFEGDAELEKTGGGKLFTSIFAVCLKQQAAELEAALRSIGFAAASGDAKLTCAQRAEQLQDRRKALIKELDVIQSLICGFAEQRRMIEFAADFYTMRAERYVVYGELLQSESSVLLSGYMPEKFSDELQKNVEQQFTAAVEIYYPDENDEDVPVALSNGAFSAPCEGLLAMYSMPARNDIDPTAPMAFFFYLFFGMMLSDAGYGLLITLACCIALRKFTLEPSMRRSLTMFRNCGISTMAWGLVFGGFFGDLIPKLIEKFTGNVVTMPALIDPVRDSIMLLSVGIGLGVVHLLFGLCLMFYNLCRQGHVFDAFCDAGSWIVTLLGAVGLLGGMLLNISIIMEIGKYAFIAGLAALVLTQGRKKKGFGKAVGGIASLYDITGYASDILSYCRLMALGIATSVLASVINQLSVGAGILGIIIFVFGTAICFGMNALGAYVHTLRLQYVEFFSKFYEGGGRLFTPFAAKTRFIRLSSDEQNKK